MDILYLAHRIPFPPNKGDKLRAFRHIKYLAKNHRVWCACFVDCAADQMSVAPLASYCHELIAIPLSRTKAVLRGMRRLAAGGTITEGFYDSSAMRMIVDDWGSCVPFDAVVAFSSSMAPYALRVPAARRVLDLCDVDSAKWLAYADVTTRPKSWFYRAEGRRLSAQERTWCSSFDSVVVISEAEAALLRPNTVGGKVHVISNGVDLPAITDSPDSLLTKRIGRDREGLDQSRPRGPVVGFVGVMDYRPNVDGVCWFVEECWPAIRAEFPGAEFRIVGRNPAARVRRLRHVPGVVVVGEVHIVSTELAGFDVSVAPLRLGRGLQNKVLEAMAHGKPVVMTRCAAQGIAVHPGLDGSVTDDPSSFTAAVVNLLRDPEMRAQYGAAGRAFVATHHRWDEQGAKLEGLITTETQQSHCVPVKDVACSIGPIRSSGDPGMVDSATSQQELVEVAKP